MTLESPGRYKPGTVGVFSVVTPSHRRVYLYIPSWLRARWPHVRYVAVEILDDRIIALEPARKKERRAVRKVIFYGRWKQPVIDITGFWNRLDLPWPKHAIRVRAALINSTLLVYPKEVVR